MSGSHLTCSEGQMNHSCPPCTRGRRLTPLFPTQSIATSRGRGCYQCTQQSACHTRTLVGPQAQTAPKPCHSSSAWIPGTKTQKDRVIHVQATPLQCKLMPACTGSMQAGIDLLYFIIIALKPCLCFFFLFVCFFFCIAGEGCGFKKKNSSVCKL